MIRRKSTGSPKELAGKLGISERWLYNLLRELKEELGCPIVYDHIRRSYIYEKEGKIVIGFREKGKGTREINGGSLISSQRCIYEFSSYDHFKAESLKGVHFKKKTLTKPQSSWRD